MVRFMACLELSTPRTSIVVQLLCFFALCTIIVGSPTLEIRPQSTVSQSLDYQNLKANTAHYYPRRKTWATSRHNRRTPTFGEALMSIFKNVDYGDNTILVVGQDGTTPYRTIQEAIDQVPENNTRRTTIYVTTGVYTEKVLFPANKPCITLQGEGSNRTIITWNDTAASAGTLMSASVVVESDHFIARDISFRAVAPCAWCTQDGLTTEESVKLAARLLTVDILCVLSTPELCGTPVANQMHKQAAAFRISGDMAFLYRCSFYGHQDTLYDHSGRHYYFRCFIEGSEDFVFGVGRSLFEMCWLHSIAQGDGGALVAQGKYYPGSIMGESGFAFLRCIITGSRKPYLGRAWGQYSTVVYSHCRMDANINTKGWYDWDLQERDRTVYFGQYRCTGRGANTTGRVYWARELTNAEARPFLGIGFVDGPW